MCPARQRASHFFFILLILICLELAGGESFLGYFFGAPKVAPNNATKVANQDIEQNAKGSLGTWSSLLTVDPSSILVTLIERGGLFMPKSIQKELLSVAHVCHVEKAELNLAERRLLFHNFTVGMARRKKALSVRKVLVTWDSYSRPCVSIEVSDVDVLVEFTNILLTRNNW